jgi:hypothetical protein
VDFDDYRIEPFGFITKGSFTRAFIYPATHAFIDLLIYVQFALFDESASVLYFMYCAVLSIFRFQEKLGCCRNTYRVSIFYSYLYHNETYCVNIPSFIIVIVVSVKECN